MSQTPHRRPDCTDAGHALHDAATKLPSLELTLASSRERAHHSPLPESSKSRLRRAVNAAQLKRHCDPGADFHGAVPQAAPPVPRWVAANLAPATRETLSGTTHVVVVVVVATIDGFRRRPRLGEGFTL